MTATDINTAMQTSNALKLALTDTITNINTAQTFLINQLPDVIKQVLQWEFLYSLSMCILGLVIFVMNIVYLKWAFTRGVRDVDYLDILMYKFLYILCGILILIISVVCINFNWLEILIAPKVYLLEYSTNLFN